MAFRAMRRRRCPPAGEDPFAILPAFVSFRSTRTGLPSAVASSWTPRNRTGQVSQLEAGEERDNRAGRGGRRWEAGRGQGRQLGARRVG